MGCSEYRFDVECGEGTYKANDNSTGFKLLKRFACGFFLSRLLSFSQFNFSCAIVLRCLERFDSVSN